MKRRLLPVVVLLSCAEVVAAAILSRSFLFTGGSDRAATPGAFDSEVDAESRELDRQLRSTDAHRELLDRLSADLIAGRRTLPEAADLLADFARQRKPEWLRGVGRRYPGRSEKAWRPNTGPAPATPLTLPEPVKGAALPPFWRAAGLVRDEVRLTLLLAEHRGTPKVYLRRPRKGRAPARAAGRSARTRPAPSTAGCPAADRLPARGRRGRGV
jgi:hypothetical protein